MDLPFIADFARKYHIVNAIYLVALEFSTGIGIGVVDVDTMKFKTFYTTSIRSCHSLVKAVSTGTNFLLNNKKPFEPFSVGVTAANAPVMCSVQGDVVVVGPEHPDNRYANYMTVFF